VKGGGTAWGRERVADEQHQTKRVCCGRDLKAMQECFGSKRTARGCLASQSRCMCLGARGRRSGRSTRCARPLPARQRRQDATPRILWCRLLHSPQRCLRSNCDRKARLTCRQQPSSSAGEQESKGQRGMGRFREQTSKLGAVNKSTRKTSATVLPCCIGVKAPACMWAATLRLTLAAVQSECYRNSVTK